MSIKKKIPRLMSVLLSFSMAFGGVIPAYATEAIITENSIEEAEFDAMVVNEIDEEAVADEIEAQADSDSRYETVEVNYSQSSNYFVTIPKTIVLGTDKMSPYSIKVEGDIVANKQVCVVPVDGIEETEVFDFYMSDQITGSTKADVVAEVSQTKFYWSHEEVAAGYEENDNYIVADGLSAGKWKGIFQLEISMRTDPTHIHNYVGEVTKEPTCTESGEKTYTCDCGDSYVETIDPTGHHFEKGECTICGEKDPDHEHNYTEAVTKQPTCTEDGEKAYTCDCGDSYTEVIPATGHHYVDGECEHCGEKDPDAHIHNYIETITKEPTCIEEGEKTYTCNCGDSYTEVIPATDHHYVDGECEHCGGKDPDAHTHNYIETITKEATCAEDGEKKYTCECGDSYTQVIPAGHHYGDDDKCIECGEFNPNHTHNYVDNTNLISWENTSNGTYAFIKEGTKWTSNNKGIKSSTATSTWTITLDKDTEYSLKYKVSSEASYDKLTIKLNSTTIANAISGAGEEITYTGTLTAGTHTLTATYVKDSSTDKNDDCGYIILEDMGESNHKCIKCGHTESHTYEDTYTIDIDATCDTNGSKSRHCTKCDAKTDIAAIPSIGHIYEDTYTIDKEPTCTEKGIKSRHCTRCDSKIDKTAIPKMGHTMSHTFVDGICTVCGTSYEPDPYELAPEGNIDYWDYTLDNVNNIITLNYCKYWDGDDVIVYANYPVNGKVYKTQIANHGTTDPSYKYMFSHVGGGNFKKTKTITFSRNIDTSNVTDMSCMFYGCKSLISINGISNWNTSNVTDMSYMFYDCNALESLDLSNWDVSKVTNMSNMFYFCLNLKSLNLFDWVTSNVTNMSCMFHYCGSLTLDLTSFDTSKVTTMNKMFNGADATEIRVSRSKWVIPSGCDTQYMFYYCGCSGVTYVD